MKPANVYSYQDNLHEHQRRQSTEPRPLIAATAERCHFTDGELIALVALATAIITALLVL